MIVSFLASTLLASFLESLKGLDFVDFEREYETWIENLASTSDTIAMKVHGLGNLFKIFNRDLEKNIRKAADNRQLKERIADNLAPVYDFDNQVIVEWTAAILKSLEYHENDIIVEIPRLVKRFKQSPSQILKKILDLKAFKPLGLFLSKSDVIPQETIENVSKKIKDYLETRWSTRIAIYGGLKEMTRKIYHMLESGEGTYSKLTNNLGRPHPAKGTYYGENVESPPPTFSLVDILKSLSIQDRDAPFPWYSLYRAWIYLIIFGSFFAIASIAVIIYSRFF